MKRGSSSSRAVAGGKENQMPVDEEAPQEDEQQHLPKRRKTYQGGPSVQFNTQVICV